MSEALDLLAALVLEDGRRWGEAAVDVQWEDARAVLNQSSPTPYHWLGRARGYSKTSDLGGMGIGVLLAQAPPRARLYGIAADQAQGTLLVDAIGGFASRTPELQGALQIQELKVVGLRSGATLTILPADSASVWGLRPAFVVADEVTQWHETARTLRVWEGVTTGLAKVAGSRLVVLGTAGDPAHFSYGIRNQALDDGCNSHSLDYEALAEWCRERRGLKIVCEQSGASWLPFRHLRSARDSIGNLAAEVVWVNPEHALQLA